MKEIGKEVTAGENMDVMIGGGTPSVINHNGLLRSIDVQNDISPRSIIIRHGFDTM